jgi:uncharacterized membrane protein
MRRRALPVALLAAAFGLTFAFGPWDGELVSDIPLYRGYADFFLDGLVPYRDIGFEYPPLAWPLMALPGLVSLELDEYRLVFTALAFATAVGLALACARLARLGCADERRALFAVAVAPIATGAIIRTHFDLAAVLCLVAGLAWIAAGRPRAGFVVLGLGGALKLFPLMAVPVAAAWLVGRGQRREALVGVAAAAAVMLAAAGFAAAASPEGAWDAVEYHLERPTQIESLPASVLNAVDAAGGREPEPVHSHRSDGLSHPADTAVEVVFTGLLFAALAALSLAALRAPRVRVLALAGLGSALAFAALGKVLSPQFMIWLVPLAALAWAWRLHALAAATTAAIGATMLWFPERYFDLVDREAWPLLAVGLRNAILVVVLALLARDLARMVRESRGAAGSTPQDRPGVPRPAPR